MKVGDKVIHLQNEIRGIGTVVKVNSYGTVNVKWNNYYELHQIYELKVIQNKDNV